MKVHVVLKSVAGTGIMIVGQRSIHRKEEDGDWYSYL